MRAPPSSTPLSPAQIFVRLAMIGVLAALVTGAFAYVGGWLDPHRLKPANFVDALEKNGGVHPGFRRNHAKGVCVLGSFVGNGAASGISTASVFKVGTTPVVGRFALPAASPFAPDGSVPIRSMALRFELPDDEQWRTGMNSMPVFPVSTPQAFFDLLTAGAPNPDTGKPDPAKQGAFFGSHPETAAFLSWVKTARLSSSYATETYWSLNAFYLVDANGHRQAVRWQMVPDQASMPDDVAPAGVSDFLEADLDKRIGAGPLTWHLQLVLADPLDPIDDATKAWPAARRTIDAGILHLTDVQPQELGECRDINFDPLILPSGIEPSEDPLLAARSAAYANSYQRRTREEAIGAVGPEVAK